MSHLCGVSPTSMHLHPRLLAAAIVVSLAAIALPACRRAPDGRATPAASSATSAPLTPPAPTGAPLAALAAVHPASRAMCPLAIVPGKSLGPVGLGETLDDLRKAGLTIEDASDHHARIRLPGASGLHLGVTLCEGKIIDVWIDGLPADLDCVTYGGEPVSARSTTDELARRLGPCTDEAPRIGGSFQRCADGGVFLGRSLGPATQIRVRPRGWPFDHACAVATDDGSPAPLTPAERTTMFQKTLMAPELSSHWHVDTAGRDPLRVVRTPLVPESSFRMFGSEVVWIDATDAKKGTAYFEVRSLDATKTRATLGFAYPIEGVSGVASWSRASGEWRLVSVKLTER